MKLSTYANKLGISYYTAWRHFHKGYIEGAYQLESGTIIVPDDIVEEVPDEDGPPQAGVYARVSSSENKDNLESQAQRVTDYCAARGYQVTRVVKEVGSGVNDGRKQFLSLLTDDGVDIIVVEHKDRATRFGFNYIQRLLESQGRSIEVINATENDKEELMNDLIAIITSFVARYYGHRRAKRKTEQIIKELQEE